MLIKTLVSGLGGQNSAMEQPLAGARACAVPLPAFDVSARIMKSANARLCAEWAADETLGGGGYEVWALYNLGTEYVAVGAKVERENPTFPTLTGGYVQAYRFERRIASFFGITPKGHPDQRPWIKHEDWPADAYPLRKSFQSSEPLPRAVGTYEFARVNGEGVFEIPVGPVHAGIIEPGHFRFQAVGEKVLNMEEKLGYVHKGIEKRFESLGWPKMARLAGRVSGDSTVAHALGFCMAFEKLSGAKSAERANWIRALLLERERMANHLADLAAITNDTSFTFCFYQFWNLRERMLRTNQKLFGHRLLMDVVTPGGVANDLDHGGVSAILEEFKFILPEFERIAEIFDGRPSLKDRLYNTGVLLPAVAENLGLVGFAGRASGRDLDARKQWLFSPYDVVAPNTHVLHSGDVHARAWMRIEEFRDSARMIKEFLGLMPKGAVVTPPLAPPPNTAGFSAVEGWRGEIIYWLKTAPDGSLGRCMVRDPSNVNWLALEQSVKADMVPDFPVNNKSWNNSYSGNDL